MGVPLLDIEQQFIFYGSYHANPINIAVHMIFVPVLIWSGQAMMATLPVPSFFPAIHHEFNRFLVFNLNWSFLVFVVGFLGYFFLLLPSAAITYAPIMILSNLTSSAFTSGERPFDPMSVIALCVHLFSWVVQILSHRFAEKRAPALLKNLIGALVLAPFFVHLEVLFHVGLYQDLHRRIVAGVERELQKLRVTKKED